MSIRNKSEHDFWLTCGFLALLAWMPLPLGSKLPWAIAIAEIWCFILAIAVLFKHFRRRQTLPPAFRSATFPLLCLFANLIWLLIQSMHLPIVWVRALSPHAASIYEAAGSTASISLDRMTTWNHFVTSAFLVTGFMLAIYLFDSKKKLTWLVYTVLISALFQVLYGAMMILTGMEYSFFISKAALHSHIGSATGTFTSRDHLAGYLEMSLSLGVGYMITLLRSEGGSSRHWNQRIKSWVDLLLGPKARLRLILLLLCLGLVLTHSRGGNLGFFSSIAAAGLLFLLLARKKPRSTILFLTSLIILDIIIIGSWVGVSKVMHRLEATSLQTELRDNTDAATLPMVQDYLLTGTGAGTYFEVFPAYKTPILSQYWNHAHNDYLEFLSEQGAVGFSLLAGVVICSLMTALSTFRHRRNQFIAGMSFASLMASIALLVHSSVDFNLQIGANSMLFVILLAIPFICRRLDQSRAMP